MALKKAANIGNQQGFTWHYTPLCVSVSDMLTARKVMDVFFQFSDGDKEKRERLIKNLIGTISEEYPSIACTPTVVGYCEQFSGIEDEADEDTNEDDDCPYEC